jgi:hypothetical protein
MGQRTLICAKEIIMSNAAAGKTSPPQSAFTIVGYNDSPKPCPKKGCEGQIQPTANANIGECDTCGTTHAWSDLA